MITVTEILAFNDNYIWSIQEKGSKNVYIVDPGDAIPVIKYLDTNQLNLAGILITHHHHDHTGGINKLLQWVQEEIPVYGPANENIVGINQPISNAGEISLINSQLKAEVFLIPGHTLGHISYLIDDCLFCGDTLFSGGCGRLFEGSPAQMLASLSSLARLKDDVKVYCAHEYTQSNLKFALEVEPNNHDLLRYNDWVNEKRQQNLPTLPSTIGLEKNINPFMRIKSRSIINILDSKQPNKNLNDVSRFALLRQWKDIY